LRTKSGETSNGESVTNYPTQEKTSISDDLKQKQEQIAAAFALAVITARGERPALAVFAANNNSICQAFLASEKFSPLCQHYCGEAAVRAFAAKEKGEDAAHYRCHAHLRCVALPVEFQNGERGAIIGGRAFTSVADYRATSERLRAGEWRELAADETFQNILFAAEADLNALAARLRESIAAGLSPIEKEFAAKSEVNAKDAEKNSNEAQTESPALNAEDESGATEIAASEVEAANEIEKRIEKGEAPFESADAILEIDFDAAANPSREKAAEDSSREKTDEANRLAPSKASTQPSALPEKRRAGEFASRQQNFIVVPSRAGNFKDACRALLRPLLEKYQLNSLTLVVRHNLNFIVGYATGKFTRRIPLVMLDPTDTKRVRLVATNADDESLNQFEAFPLIVDNEVRGALIVESASLNDAARRALQEFCRDAALPLEVLRLREEIEQRRREEAYLQAFIERLNTVEPTEAYSMIVRYFAETLHSERGSLLLYDEHTNELIVKAALGARAEVARQARLRSGEGIAGYVLENARPLVVRDLRVAGVAPAPAERRYKTNSFISFPIIAGGRKVGVLNVTDKAGGGEYDEADLRLLETIAPQIALALDRAEWHNRATQFELLSITDPLTGLLNRRYLEERVSEEVKRSKRYHYPMSFMMLDIDDFKKYNDQNGHQAGDEALKMAAECLKTTLRGADVPARYGGEEFCVLLPQTTIEEARFIAERIRSCIRQTVFPHGRKQPQGYVSVSIGIAALSHNLDTAEAIMHAADDALYVAKRRGKDRVETAEE
jgi:diguanylate cyclase (GGDEF)-like protein